MNNPIKDNRIVSSHTYAIRNLAFLASLYPEDGSYSGFTGPMDEEEYDYLCKVACDLIRYQVETCPDFERWYFENLVKNYKDGNDIIKNFVCKNHPIFYKYLKTIKTL